jgi:hypothetical protein
MVGRRSITFILPTTAVWEASKPAPFMASAMPKVYGRLGTGGRLVASECTTARQIVAERSVEVQPKDRQVALGDINPEGGAVALDDSSYHDEAVMNAKGISRQWSNGWGGRASCP